MKPLRRHGTRRIHKLLTAAGVALSMGMAACSTQVGEPADEAADAQAQSLAAKQAQADHEAHRYRGPVSVVAERVLALESLRADQRSAIQALADDARTERHMRRDATKADFRASAVAIVRDGTAKSARFEGAVDKAAGAMRDAMQANHEVLVDIHAQLTPEQRAEVADGLDDYLTARIAAHKGRKGSFKRVAKHLVLRAAQIDKLKAIRDHWRKDEERVHPTRDELFEMIDHFRGENFAAEVDAFEARKLAVLERKLEKAGEHTDTLLSILDADQRAVLADMIEQGPRKVLGLEEAAPKG